MTTYSSVSMDFGGFKKNSPMIFQNDERSPMDFKGRNVCLSPDDEEFESVKSRELKKSAPLSIIRIYYRYFWHDLHLVQ